MTLFVEGDAKEIAALVLLVQGRQLDKEIAEEITTILQKEQCQSGQVFQL